MVRLVVSLQYSLSLVNLFTRLQIEVRSLRTYLLTYLLTHLLACFFSYLLTYSLTPSYSLTHPPTHQLSLSLTRSLNHNNNNNNVGTRLWRDFDRRYFRASGKSKKEREILIRRNKKEIAKALNENFQKVYFATKSNGDIVELYEMTYAEVLRRMIALMYVPNRWLDVTYRDMVQTFLERVHERFLPPSSSSSSVPDFSSSSKESPTKILENYLNNVVPRSKTQLVLLEDVDFFLQVCRKGKPVPFVPVIDGDLESWFKKDSLWYSEDLDAVRTWLEGLSLLMFEHECIALSLSLSLSLSLTHTHTYIHNSGTRSRRRPCCRASWSNLSTILHQSQRTRE
jgi:hypothetical protein